MFSLKSNYKARPAWAGYGMALASVLLGWAAREALTPGVGETALPFIFFFPAAALAAWYGGFGPGALATVLGAAAAKWFFLEPVRAWSIGNTGNAVALATFLVSCLFIVGAIEAMHRGRANEARQKTITDLTLARYELVLRGAEAAIWDWDVPGKRVVFSPRWKQMRGLAEDEASDGEEEWSRGIHPDDRERVLEAVQAHFNGKTAVFAEEYRVRHKDGRWIWILGRGIARRDAAGQIVRMAGSETDITDRKLAEEERRHRSEQLETLVNRAPLGIYMVDADFRIAQVNPVALPVFGDIPGGVIGRDFNEIIQMLWEKKFAREVVRLFRHTLETGESHFDPERAEYRIDRQQIEYYEWRLDRITLPDGRYGLVCYFRDISRQVEARKKVEESRDALRESEARQRERAAELQAIFDASPIGLAIAHDPQGMHIRGNPANERLVGVPPGGELSLRGPERAGYRALRDGQEVLVDALPMQRACRGETVTGDVLEVVRPDGNRVTLYCSAVPLQDEAGQPRGAVGAFMDLTELRSAQDKIAEQARALESAHARLQGVISSAMDGIITIDSRQGIVLFNPAAEAMFGMSAKEAAGREISFLIPERYRSTHGKFVEAFGRTGVSSRQMGSLGAVSGVRASGEEFPIEASISQIEIGGEKLFTVILRDITERKKAEERQGHLAAIVEHSEDAIIGNTPDGKLSSWNPGAEALFGYSAAEMIGQSISRIIPPECAKEEEIILTRLRAGESVHRETSRLKKNGERVAVSITASPIKDATGKVIGESNIARDITERKATEEKLREAQRKLLLHAADLEATVAERTAKLQESVNELQSFSYSIAHDMRAPLRAMGTFAQLLKTEIKAANLPPDTKTYCERIVIGAARLDNLINDALNYTKAVLQEFPIQPMDLSKLIRGLVDTYPTLHSESANILIEEHLPAVLGNESLLTQCFSNLLGNAVKFVAPGIRPDVRVRSQTGNGLARIWVEDNGIGIPKHAQPRLFAMFQKLDNQYEGTGVGLAIVRKAVERMGGKVGVESEPGQGSRFWVELRMAPTKEDI